MHSEALGLHATLITDLEGVAEIEDSWRRLAELRGNGFVTPEWLRAWYETRPSATSPLVVAAHHPDGALAGVLPLIFDFGRRPRRITFPAAMFGDRFEPAAREEDAPAVVRAAVRALSDAGFDRYMLSLDNVETETSWWRALHNETAGSRAGIVQGRAEQPYIDLRGLDWDRYLETRSSSFRKKLRQRDRKLDAAGEVAVRETTSETLDADLGHYFDLHERRWQERSSILSSAGRAFLTSFARHAQDQGWLRLRLLEVDAEPVAALLGWRVGERFAFYNSGFDPDWSDLSVGTVMLTRTVEAAIEEGAAEFDMLLGDESYKRRFQNESRWVETVVLPRATAPSRILVSAETRAKRLGRRLVRQRGGRTLRRMLPRRL